MSEKLQDQKLQDQFQCSTPRPASLPGKALGHSLSDIQDHFAAIAMQTILAASHPASCIVDYNDIACRAYLMARAMMRRRAMMHSG